MWGRRFRVPNQFRCTDSSLIDPPADGSFLWDELFAYRLDRIVILRRNPLSSQSGFPSAVHPLTPVPAWVGKLLGNSLDAASEAAQLDPGSDFRLVSACISDADVMDGDALGQASAEAYRSLRLSLVEGGPWHPVRIWNFVPRILGQGGGAMDRYMRFNAGRYRAFTEWFGGAQGFDSSLPAASAVGYAGSDLVAHALAARAPGTAIANPRQRDPHRYSKRFGPLPPCFARATRLESSPAGDILLVGGTSSVRGEESVHVGNLQLQLAETLENLAALVQQAFGPSDQPLSCYRELRVYYLREADLLALRSAVTAAFPHVSGIEWVQAELCRGDLLVEIEGLASASAG